MISTDFAPNEDWKDAAISLITLISPWSWKRGEANHKANKQLESVFPSSNVTLLMSARVGIKLALGAFNLPPKSEIIVHAFTCEAVVLPILALGLKPVYVDIEKETFSAHFESLQQKISPHTKVIILQHAFGMIPKNRDKVLQLAKDRNIYVIEDLAHGFDPVFWQKEKISDNQVLTLSFGRSKALSSVFGGALITNNNAFHEKIASLISPFNFPSSIFIIKLLCYKPLALLIRSTYSFLSLGKIIHKIVTDLRLMVAEISVKEKMGRYDSYLELKYPNCLAKLLTIQLEKYPIMQKQRKIICNIYSSKIKVKSSIPKDAVLSRFPLLVENRDAVVEKAAQKNIFLGTWYNQPVGPKQLDMSKVGYRVGSCPVAEKVCRSIINLPTLVTINKANEITEMINDQ